MTSIDPATDVVLVDRMHGGRVAVLTLNRPPAMNAINTALALALDRIVTDLDADSGVRAVFIIGAGQTAFSAGGDLKERAGMTPSEWTRQHEIFESAHRKVRQLRKPIFAVVNGVAVGG